jgi:hypothetical protein
MQTENKMLHYSSLLLDGCDTLKESAKEIDHIVDCMETSYL